MSYKILIDKKVDKFLEKLEKGQIKEYQKIMYFLTDTLKNTAEPVKLPNAKRLQGFKDNRYRWRLGDYRIIGLVKDGEFKLIQIIKISKRDEKTYKGL